MNMNIDLHLMLEARNYTIKLEQELQQTNQKWLSRLDTLEEAYEELESERNELRRKLQERR